jgi:hypothetical protein
MSLQILIGLGRQFLILEGSMMQLLLKFPGALLNRRLISEAPGFHFPDALFEMLYMGSVSLRLFTRLRRDLFMLQRRLSQLLFEFL